MLLRKLWMLLCFMVGLTCFALTDNASPRVWERQRFLLLRGQQLWHAAVHDSKFSLISDASTPNRCQETETPQPLATPNPLLNRGTENGKIRLSVVIGTDGRVHSPLILEGIGGTDDGVAVKTVRAWRYRPATCNGVATEAEGKIQFSIR